MTRSRGFIHTQRHWSYIDRFRLLLYNHVDGNGCVKIKRQPQSGYWSIKPPCGILIKQEKYHRCIYFQSYYAGEIFLVQLFSLFLKNINLSVSNQKINVSITRTSIKKHGVGKMWSRKLVKHSVWNRWFWVRIPPGVIYFFIFLYGLFLKNTCSSVKYQF